MLLQGGMLLLVVVGFFFVFCFLLFGFSSAYVQQRSPVPAATTPQPTPHESRLHGQLLSHSLSPCCWGTGTFRQPLQTQHHQLLAHHCQSWADVFLGVQAETWHLSYTCVQTPLGLYLAQGLRQLYRYYVCTILTDSLCCLLPRARCSFWMLSSFSVIPVPPLPPPTPPPVSGNYSFGAFNQPSHTVVDRSCSSLVAHLSSSCTHSWHIPKSTKANSSLHAHCTVSFTTLEKYTTLSSNVFAIKSGSKKHIWQPEILLNSGKKTLFWM